jgi:peroxin-5
MDERERPAMQALAEGVRAAEAGGAPGAGMLTLAISYTNEAYDRGANALLLRWLRARYPEHPVPPETLASTRQSAWHSTPLVTDAFLSLARAQHAAAGEADADVQAALGALLYARGEYARAGECFGAALGARPGDARLWNRYGSCLSNGAAPEAALAAYREALRLRPAYTRAVYNVAVACLNVGAHREAAEHLLDALASQGSEGERSEQCWTTLARVFRMMVRAPGVRRGRPDADARAAGPGRPRGLGGREGGPRALPPRRLRLSRAHGGRRARGRGWGRAWWAGRVSSRRYGEHDFTRSAVESLQCMNICSSAVRGSFARLRSCGQRYLQLLASH